VKALVSVARTEADKKKEAEAWEKPSTSAMDDYPYGLRLYLDNETIQKLGIGDFDAGDPVMICAEGMITEDSINVANGVKRRSLSIQITKICLDQEGEMKDVATELYGNG